METESATIHTECPECGHSIVINKVWFPGGLNDYGNFEVQCNKCDFVFEIPVGRDVDASNIQEGAKLIKRKYRDG